MVAVEPLGAETLLVVALDASNDELIARTGRDTALAIGDRFDIAFDTVRHPSVRSRNHEGHRLSSEGWRLN